MHIALAVLVAAPTAATLTPGAVAAPAREEPLPSAADVYDPETDADLTEAQVRALVTGLPAAADDLPLLEVPDVCRGPGPAESPDCGGGGVKPCDDFQECARGPFAVARGLAQAVVYVANYTVGVASALLLEGEGSASTSVSTDCTCNSGTCDASASAQAHAETFPTVGYNEAKAKAWAGPNRQTTTTAGPTSADAFADAQFQGFSGSVDTGAGAYAKADPYSGDGAESSDSVETTCGN